MRVGVVGAGQLGLMLGEAGRELGIECRFLDPSRNPPAARAGEVIRAAFDDSEALEDLLRGSDVLTYEFENVPVAALSALAGRKPVRPPPSALCHAQDRVAEKRLFEHLAIPLPRYAVIRSPADLENAASKLDFPFVVKTRRLGYDGKGQVVVRNEAELPGVLTRLGPKDLVAEEWVPFDLEVSAIGVRSVSGDVAIYPLTENRHREGILRVSLAPFAVPALLELASRYLRRILDHLEYVGVLALELFVVGDRLLANEVAPRVHNSGHWTIEGAATSQFANHLLAITGRPPGSTAARGHAAMVNLIGEITASARRAGSRHFLHDYGKSPRPGRKLGHITLLGDSAAERDRELERLELVL